MLDRDDRVLTFLGRRRQTDSATPKHQKTSSDDELGRAREVQSWVGGWKTTTEDNGSGRRRRRLVWCLVSKVLLKHITREILENYRAL